MSKQEVGREIFDYLLGDTENIAIWFDDTNVRLTLKDDGLHLSSTPLTTNTTESLDKQYSVDDAIFDIEDYIGGNVDGVESVDYMGLTVFLRTTLTKLSEQEVLRGQRDELEKLPKSEVGKLANHSLAVDTHVEDRLKEINTLLGGSDGL